MTSYSQSSAVLEAEQEFAKRYPAQLDGEVVEDEVAFTWCIDDWNGLPSRALSEPFDVGNHRWRALLFPEGNNVPGARGSISFFLKLMHTAQSEAVTEDSPANTSAITEADRTAMRQKKVKTSPTINATGKVEGAEVPAADSHKESLEIVNNGDLKYVVVPTTQRSVTTPKSDGAVCINASLILWNPDNPKAHHVQYIQKRYDKNIQDWGYSQFAEVRALMSNTSNGDAILDNNKLNATILARVIKDPTGLLWKDDLRDYDSKQSTGYVGLLNQGATCYLNSLVQSLYFTKVFRQTVYNMTTGKGDSLANNLQRLFFQLGTSDQPVGTLPLTKSFGWDSADAFTQHDVQELNRVLMDRLETALKGSQLAGELSNMFVGQMKSFIKCIDIDFESARVEDFWDIQLNVKGCPDVYASFDNYVETEFLSGENQYQASGHGLQDAKKGVIFHSFPPVLHLQLKRYEYDYLRDIEIKINDRYEYPLDLDLSKYVEPTADSQKSKESWNYALHGVLVHSGDLNAGHYYALIKPEADGTWYRFDDDFVTKAMPNEVLEANFGGESLTSNGTLSQGAKRITSAYMLVYIQKSRLDYVLPSGDDFVPYNVFADVLKEQESEQKRREADLDRERHMHVRVHDVAKLRHHNSIGLGPWFKKNGGQAAADLVRVSRAQTIGSFFSDLLKKYHLPTTTELWLMTSREATSQRISSLQPFMDHEVSKLADWSEDPPIVWLEEKPGDPKSHLLVFIKEYNTGLQTLESTGTRWISLSSTFDTIFDRVPCIAVYKEIRGALAKIPLELRVDAAGLDQGAIIVVETHPAPTQEEADKLGKANATHMGAEYFYKLLNHRVTLSVISKRHLALLDGDIEAAGATPGAADADELLVTASTIDPYDLLAERVARTVGADAKYLALYVATYDTVVGLKSDGSNMSRLFPYEVPPQGFSPRVIYDILDQPLTELEQLREVTVVWAPENFSHASQLQLRLHKDALLPALLEALEEAASVTKGALDQVKVWVSQYAREILELREETRVGELDIVDEVYASFMPKDEADVRRKRVEGKLTSVFHYYHQPSNTHSVPFTFALLEGEPWSVTRERLRMLLGYSDKVFDKIPVTIYSGKLRAISQSLDDDDLVLAETLKPGDLIGLDHIDLKRRGAGSRSAIVIK